MRNKWVVALVCSQLPWLLLTTKGRVLAIHVARCVLVKCQLCVTALSILVVHLLIQTRFHYLPESIAIVIVGKCGPTQPQNTNKVKDCFKIILFVFSAISILVVHLLICTKFHYLPESIAVVSFGKQRLISVSGLVLFNCGYHGYNYWRLWCHFALFRVVFYIPSATHLFMDKIAIHVIFVLQAGRLLYSVYPIGHGNPVRFEHSCDRDWKIIIVR